MAEGGGMDLRTLAPQQLQSLNEQLESDIAALQDSMQTLSQAAMRFHKSGVALEELMKQEPGAELCVFFVNDTNFIDDLLFAGKKMLVPLTSSLYAPGTLGDSGRVLLDIGTGYFAEYTPEAGRDYCKRKVVILKENIEKVEGIMVEKRGHHRQVSQVMQMKLAAAQKAAAGGSSMGTISE